MKRLTNSLFLHAFNSLKTLIIQNLCPQALRVSTSLHSPYLTDTTYALFIKSGFVLDPILATSLITHFSLSGDFSRATQFLRDTNNPDTVVYNSLISGYARVGQSKPVFALFNGLRQVGLKPDVYTLSSLIKACDSLEQNEIAHGVSIRMGFDSGAFLVSGLIENYSKSGLVDSAEKCFEGCLVLDSVVWTAMINGYGLNEELEKGRKVFMEMKGLGLELNEFSLTSVLGSLLEVKEGGQIHGFSVKMGFLCGRSTHLTNAVMNMYCRCGTNADAVKVFDEISDPDVVSWTVRIGAACDGVEALEMFKICCSRGVEINEYTLTNVLPTIGDPVLLKPGKQIHALSYKAGHLLVVSVNNALISMYGKSGQMGDAKRVFDELICPDSVSWNSLITGYSENGFVSEAMLMFSQMRDFLQQPNKYTLASILDGVSNSNSSTQAMLIHSLIIKLGFALNNSMLCCLITAYGKCNRIDKSKKVFSEIDEVNMVHLNAMAGTFVRAGYHVDALKLFQTMWSLSHEVDSVSFSMILKACGALTDLDQGRIIHSLAIKTGIIEDNFVESAIVDAYCKCGSIDDAEKAFRNISKDNLAAWNAMMMGYAQRGCYYDVLNLFEKMSELGMKHDEITYLGVLSSCCHAGLVNEAQFYLRSMFERHGVIPCLEHYACIVDMLGRVGFLEDAKKTIDHMPICPDAQIWQILLSACNIHGNVDLGKIAARKLLELQPENDSAYILLSNLYASAGMWNAVGKLRREMKEKMVCKEPACSWIQVRGSIHYFFACDSSHPESAEVDIKLQSLNKHIFPLHDSDLDGISSFDI
ncbi:putative pentatricopeptide repeat-containing protein At3g25970 [Cornus florida]|uniref:putative pentatricopeptide repeat-containing protein At3g25970 n=1 Tax=Cornus florida TaxID=4283 RepID=UPI00289A4410|nr:putative pentatricopeptide repeat-containing protein At3g25970 [Cornus florida]XP_059662284.1 putative pentatricopeptide repeat-containing protein At3g25970 [Cornus florida]XP_059662285.1 putative pentatricopeptide repeat-containing protein At3g25970 [Cornus florida]